MVVNVVGNDFDESVFVHRRRNGLFHLYPTPQGTFDYVLTPLPEPGMAERVPRRSAAAALRPRRAGRRATSYFVQMRSRLMAHARARGFRVIDTEPLFVVAFAADRRRFEHPTDGHWNAHGRAVVAAAVVAALGRPWRPPVNRARCPTIASVARSLAADRVPRAPDKRTAKL